MDPYLDDVLWQLGAERVLCGVPVSNHPISSHLLNTPFLSGCVSPHVYGCSPSTPKPGGDVQTASLTTSSASPESLPVSLSSSPPRCFHTSFTAFLITPPPFMPRYKLRLSVVSLLLEMKRDEGGRVSPLWPSAFQKMKETAAAITVTHSCLHKGSSHRLSLYPSFLIHPENLNYSSFNVLWAEATVQTFIRRKNVEMAKHQYRSINEPLKWKVVCVGPGLT